VDCGSDLAIWNVGGVEKRNEVAGVFRDILYMIIELFLSYFTEVERYCEILKVNKPIYLYNKDVF